MADFERARSLEQKEARIEEIKAAAESLFNEVPYHEITLSMIADRLSWTRANLYRYFKSKEEIFLDLDSDSMNRYYDLLMSSLPEGNDYSPDMSPASGPRSYRTAGCTSSTDSIRTP